ncbi:MAG: gamma-glutamyl-gamma-aminobutyrate hydrolase family protein [Dehalococcoidia bacterium]
MRPLIAITTGSGPGRAGERASIGAAYLNAVQGAGGLPVILPPQLDGTGLSQLMGQVQALILTGGGDIDPERYGEDRHEKTDGVSAERDELEATATKIALERGMPVLAICRGLQMLNVTLGGSLFQDVPSEFATEINHAQTSGDAPAERSDVTHGVTIEEGCRLAALVGATSLEVNSMHHQSVNRLGSGLRPVAWAPDGVVEGLELPGNGRFVVAVQWHPEELVGTHEHARRLFEALIEQAARYRR